MKKAFIFILPIFLIFLSLAYGADVKTARVERLDVPDFVGYVPNEIVVKFDPSIIAKMDKTKAPKGLMGIPSLDRVGLRYETTSILPQFPKAKKKMYRGKVVDLSGWNKIKFKGKVDVEAVVKEYKNIPGVIDAQPIGIHTLQSLVPNDPCYYYIGEDYSWIQWHLDQENDADIDAPEAWDIETGYEDIIVAVLDTGVRYFHKDLGGVNASLDHPENADGNMWINWAEKNGVPGHDDDNNNYIDDWIGYDFVVDAPEDTCGDLLGIPICPCMSDEDCGITNDGTEVGKDNDPRDFNGHGTHVAGIVAAMTNNGYATASTAGGWGDGSQQAEGNGVKIMPLRICWSADYLFYGEVGLCRMDYAAEALYYAADNGAKFANASWGSGNEGGIADAIDYFLAAGGIIVKAAGNDGDEPQDLAEYDYINSRTDPGIVSVAATDADDCKAYFSTYGDWVDVSAPGVDILSSYHNHDDPAHDWIAYAEGTSMATPLALSVAALISSQNPTWAPNQIVQQLYESADDIYGLTCNSSYFGKLGAGRVNAFNAVNINCVDNDGDNYTTCGGDCDDNDPSVNPGATEVCDGVDNNCDGQVDEGVTSTFYSDSDGDSYGDATNSIEACSAPEGYVVDNTDCDDLAANVYPGAPEICDSKDNDCDGQVDEGFASTTYYQDSDADGYGNPAVSQDACSQPAGYVTDNTDCDDGNNAVHPGATEVCDGVDNDCDGQTDEGVMLTFYQDSDGDTYGNASVTTQACEAPEGYVDNNTDCDDNNYGVNPGATETCNGVDDNCNGEIDEGLTSTTYYQDSDADGYGNPAVSQDACSQPAGYVTDNTDCDDTDSNEHPGQTWYKDADGDGYSDGTTNTASCTRPVGYFVASELTATSGDCDDGNAAVNPGATEVCDGVDNDCDGQTDEGVMLTFYQDSDGDTYGNASVTTQACEVPEGYVDNNTDCDDSDANINPDATEVCDNVDNDCDGTIDEITRATTCGVGECAGNTGEETCTAGSWGDDTCDPLEGATTEICSDGTDNDCDGNTDCYDSNCESDPACQIVCDDDRICEQGEDCSSCPNDCIGNFTGKPSSRYCCGDENCEGAEDQCNCSVDCGSPSLSETSCTNNIDDDCDGYIDCEDSDCNDAPNCTCLPRKAECTSDSQCCSNRCFKGFCK